MPDEFDLGALDIPDSSEIQELVDRCGDVGLLRFKDGEYLLREGEASQEIYVVLRGSYVVEMQRSIGEGERGDPLAVTFAEVDSPSFVGEMAYLGQSARTASVRCAGAVFTLCLKPEHLDIVIDEFPSLSRALCRQFSLRLREADEIIGSFREKQAMAARQVVLAAGETVLAAGQAASELFQLVDGVVLKDTGSSVSPVTVTNSSDDFLNARAYFQGGLNDSTFRARTPVILVVIGKGSMLAVLRNFPELAVRLLEEM